MFEIKTNLEVIGLRMANACAAAGREPASVRLLAVSKTFSAQAVAQAYAAGQSDFGENYMQEGVDKIQALAHLPLVWHCIGPIQSNKTRLVAEHFDWVHSVDRLKIAQRLSEQRPSTRAPLQVCIQVNVDGGPTKAGVPPEQAAELARQIARLPGLRLRGIMSIPEPTPDFASALAVHQRSFALYEALKTQGFALDTLSLGMSADLEAAIHAGSTLLRVGSAIFGTRSSQA
jgi:pyridoxal phosphate enzyme (YggS family)